MLLNAERKHSLGINDFGDSFREKFQCQNEKNINGISFSMFLT